MSHRDGIVRRLRLVRADGSVYLNRWGIASRRIGGVLVHRMDAPDPGIDLHDHPWTFLSIVVWGGYTEQRTATRDAHLLAWVADTFPGTCERGVAQRRRWLSARVMRLDECHRITALRRSPTWTLVLVGPVRRSWGFYMPDGWMHYVRYDQTVRAERRDLLDSHGEAR